MNLTEFLLTKLIEECSEVQKACTKALTFGLDEAAKIKKIEGLYPYSVKAGTLDE